MRSCVHVLSVVNSASNITTETIDGESHIVIRGITPIVDDIVMNQKLYPAAEIEKAYKTLENNPMPFGHPKVDGKYVSAHDVRAVNNYHVGAWFQNVKHANGKVSGDMYINSRYAEGSEKGKTLVNRLDAMAAGDSTEPIHISTGLFYSGIAANGESKNKKYKEIATNMLFDHVAILLNEVGAGTPEEGVGIFVNAEGGEQQIEVAHLSEGSDCTRNNLLNKAKFFLTNASNYSFDDIQSAINEKLREGRSSDSFLWADSVWPDVFIYRDDSKYFKQKYLIDESGKAVFVGDPIEVVRKPTEYEIKTNGEDDPMKKIIINALKEAGKPTEGKSDAELLDAYNQLVANKKDKPETPEEKAEREKKEKEDKEKNKPKEQASNSQQAPEWFAPFAEKINIIEKGLTANSDKEKNEKRAAVKAKFGLDDIAVNALDGAALDGFFAQCQASAGLNGAFVQVNNNKSFSEMPE
ncbi:DUF2213 domain-containing protein [Enterobacteriaceae bacterium ESL0689]|nr:DUF2213 domain-containing protein [Enterobacteriaceae bacterium ESL0689]